MINLEELTEDLVSKHQPKLILLYGSYARGEFTPKSDIDVVCFKEIDSVETDTREFKGLYLDGWVKPLSPFRGKQRTLFTCKELRFFMIQITFLKKSYLLLILY